MDERVDRGWVDGVGWMGWVDRGGLIGVDGVGWGPCCKRREDVIGWVRGCDRVGERLSEREGERM